VGFLSSLKKLKLKKLQPGKLITSVTHAAAALGVPGAKSLENIENRIGKRVDQATRVIAKAQDEIKREAGAQGISQAEASDRLAGRALAGAEAGLGVQANASTFLVIGGAVLLLFMLGRSK